MGINQWQSEISFHSPIWYSLRCWRWLLFFLSLSLSVSSHPLGELLFSEINLNCVELCLLYWSEQITTIQQSVHSLQIVFFDRLIGHVAQHLGSISYSDVLAFLDIVFLCMHGERDGRTLSSPSPSMFTDESNKAESNPTSGSSSHNPSTELAYLPIGCAVSAKYRGAFCSGKSLFLSLTETYVWHSIVIGLL